MKIMAPALANCSINLLIKDYIKKKKVVGLLHKIVGKQIRHGK